MAELDILNEVKIRLSISGSYHDDLLTGFIKDVKVYMKNAGVTKVDEESSVGAITRGVSDLWNLGSGDGTFSPMFRDMVTQLALAEKGESI